MKTAAIFTALITSLLLSLGILAQNYISIGIQKEIQDHLYQFNINPIVNCPNKCDNEEVLQSLESLENLYCCVEQIKKEPVKKIVYKKKPKKKKKKKIKKSKAKIVNDKPIPKAINTPPKKVKVIVEPAMGNNSYYVKLKKELNKKNKELSFYNDIQKELDLIDKEVTKIEKTLGIE